MAYPIRYRFKDRETNQVVKPGKQERHNKVFVLFPDGTPAEFDDTEYYELTRKMSTSKYILEIAITKDEKGKWIYQQIGY
jgi:hypothetical protein